ncbi:MAG: ATP synthase F0 subunit B [Myxococcota bacterium]
MQLLTVLLSGSLIDLDGTVFIQLGLFFLAFLILRPLVFGPVVRLIEARETATEGAVEEAEAMTSEAKAAEEEFEAEMRRVRLAAGEERDRLREEGKKLEATLLAKVRSETAKQLEEADAQLQKEGRQVRQAMEKEAPILARQIADTLLKRKVA